MRIVDGWRRLVRIPHTRKIRIEPGKFLWIFILGSIILASSILFGSVEAADYNVKNYGARGDGSTNDQAAIQAAINDASSHGGGNVIFDKVNNEGKYVTGNLTMKSGVTLVIEPDAQIIASLYIGDWDNHGCDTSNGGCDCDSDLMAPLIFADKATDIGIRGGGTLVGTANKMHGEDGKLCTWAICGSGPGMIFFGDVSHASIENITIKDAETVGIVLAESDHISVDNVTIATSTKWQCNDSIDIFGSQHVSITNSDIQGGDDNIALKVECNIYAARHMMTGLDCNNLEPVQDITVTGNTVYAPNGGNGLQIGWSAVGEISNVEWTDNVIRSGTKKPVSAWVRYIDEEDTSIHHIYYENNRWDTGELVDSLSINGAQKDCQFYEIYWNGELVGGSVQTAAECGAQACTCSSWENQACGGGTCSDSEMYQTRSCSPSGCTSESRCMPDPVCSATPKDGDLNQDGVVDSIDIQLCANVILGEETDPTIAENADVNNDGNVNFSDIVEIVTRIIE
jgi:hypothetical protein